MNRNRLLTDVSSKYGAPMGRKSIINNPYGKCYLYKVELIDGDYDRGGAYWGAGQPIYFAENNNFSPAFVPTTEMKLNKNY